MAAILTFALPGDLASAGERLYRVIDLGPIIVNSGGFIAGFPGDGNVTFGIDSKNQIAFARLVEGRMNAHVFLPAPDYGLDAGVYDLHALGDAPQGDPSFGENDASVATDISDDGIVVGASGQGFHPYGTSVARIWRLDQATTSPVSVPTRSIQSSTIIDGTTSHGVLTSVAHAVTNGVPGASGATVRIVGEAWVDLCSGDNVDPSWGFTVTVPGGSNPAASQMSALRPRSDSRVAFATDVNSPGGLPVGWDEEAVTEQCPECRTFCQIEPTCVQEDPSTSEPLIWPGAGTSASAMGLLPSPTVADLATRAIGINDAGQAVGGGTVFEEGEPGACRDRAAFWAEAVANRTPIVLGHVMPSGFEDDRSVALAISEPDEDGCVTIAGINLTAIRGMIWRGDGSTFSAFDLESSRVPCDGLSPIVIRQAHDVSDTRIIVGIGAAALGPRAIAITAGADINRDFVVDSADLGVLLSAYSCPNCWTSSTCIWCDSLDAADLDGDGNADCSQCVADLDCDGDIDSADLAILLGQWGVGTATIGECGLADSMTAQFGSGLSIDEALAAMGFGTPAAFAEWGSTASLATGRRGPDPQVADGPVSKAVSFRHSSHRQSLAHRPSRRHLIMRVLNHVLSNHLALAALTLAPLPGSAADAAFTEYKQNQAGWESAVGGQFTTLDFVLPGQMFVTDQYLALGALFTDGNDYLAYIPSAFPNDGWGLSGGLGPFGTKVITVEFTQPMHWIAVDHPGAVYIELFSGGEMIYASTWSGFPPASNYFIGLVSDRAFDKARIVNPFSTTVFIDNLYFGAPIPAPGVLALLPALAGLQSRRRR